MKRTRHYIPQFYLRGFAGSDGRLYAFRRDSRETFPTNVNNACQKQDLHEVTSATHGKDEGATRFLMPNHIEDRLSEFERQLAPSYGRFLECCEENIASGDDLNAARSAVCFLIAFLTEIHPHVLDYRRLSARTIATRHVESGQYDEAESELMRRQDLERARAGHRDLCLGAVALLNVHPDIPKNRLASSLFAMDVDIIRAPVGMNFVTSDAPFCYEPNGKYTVEWLYFPLSSRYAAAFYGSSHNVSYEKCSWPEAMGFNRSFLSANGLWSTALCKAVLPLRQGMQLHKALE